MVLHTVIINISTICNQKLRMLLYIVTVVITMQIIQHFNILVNNVEAVMLSGFSMWVSKVGQPIQMMVLISLTHGC